MRPPASSLIHICKLSCSEALLSLLFLLRGPWPESPGEGPLLQLVAPTPSSAQLLLKLPEAAALHPSPPPEPGEAFADLGEGTLGSEWAPSLTTDNQTDGWWNRWTETPTHRQPERDGQMDQDRERRTDRGAGRERKS